jgi:protein-S-isoprenylcysteine O-methyltransferase Ste14
VRLNAPAFIAVRSGPRGKSRRSEDASNRPEVKLFLALRALFFVLLLPGMVTGYVPYRILISSNDLHVPLLAPSSLLGLVLFVAGAAVLLRCVWDFFAAGKGTLAPIDPPRLLVVKGLYRYTRNPMYNGVLVMLAGEASFFRSLAVFEYALVVLVAFHLFVVLYEEPALDAKFQDSYRAYRRSVPRWGFTIRPYEGIAGNGP